MPLPFVPHAWKMAVRKSLLRRLGAVDAVSAWNWEGDGVATVHNTDFLVEPGFSRAYQKGLDTNSWKGSDPRFRAYIACWAALQTRDVPGDYVECGVNRGGMARAQIELLDFNRLDKSYWLVDTFSGFPDEQKHLISAGMAADSYDECFDEVQQTFAPFARVRLVRGAVPDILPQVGAQSVCFLSLDMNCAEPELAALHYFWPRLSPGALILMDDYAFTGFKRQKLALDEFAREKAIAILGMPTGQGLIVKK